MLDNIIDEAIEGKSDDEDSFLDGSISNTSSAFSEEDFLAKK